MSEAYHINITSRAAAELQAIFDHIQPESPQNAAAVTERILTAIDALEFMPGRYRIIGRSRTRGSPVHACVVRPYIVYCRVGQQQRRVFILEVRHGARRPPASFP